MNYIYLYLSIGSIVTVVLYISGRKKEKDISEVVHEKLHALSDDGSYSFNSANIIGHLLAFIFSVLFWPILALKKLLKF
jgi:hypothetical protein